MRQRRVAVAVVAALSRSVNAQDVSPIVHDGIVEAPLEAVWAAWATSDGLRSWLAPTRKSTFAWAV